MQSAKDYLKAEVTKLIAKAEDIADRAADEGRSLREEERAQVDALLKDVQDRRARIEEIDENERLKESIDRMRGPMNVPAEAASDDASSIGDAFVKSDGFQALRSSGFGGKWTTGPVELKTFGAKATVTTVASPVVGEDRRDGIQPILFRRLTIADLLASGTTDSNAVTYVQETTATNAADTVAEGAAKPESTLIMAEVTDAVRKIATFLPVSDEMLEDVDGLRSYLDGRLSLFVEHAEEEQLLNGSGTAPDIEGLLNRTGVQTVAKTAGQPIPDVVATAITNIQENAKLDPDGIVMHPTNWEAVRTAKDSNGQYYGGGPFTGPYGNGGIAGPNIWGLPVAVSSAIAVNTLLVGSFRMGAQVFRKGGLTVEASNSHSDFFQKNLTAIRAERRLALAVYRPASFHTVTALNA